MVLKVSSRNQGEPEAAPESLKKTSDFYNDVHISFYFYTNFLSLLYCVVFWIIGDMENLRTLSTEQDMEKVSVI